MYKEKYNFNWNPHCQQSLDTIEEAQIFPDPNEPYVLFTDASKESWSGLLTQECITTIKGKDEKSFLWITYVSGTFVGSQKKMGNYN